MFRPLRLGILGYADIAVRYLIPAICSMPERFVLDSVARRPTSTTDVYLPVSNGLNQPVVVSGYGCLLDDRDIDAVYIPLPTGLHYEWVKAALMSGRHVLVEKSLATNLEHVKELVEIANSKGLALMETFQFRFHPQFTAMMDMVATGAIGDLRSITAVFSFPPFKDPGNIRYQKNLGGGALLDAGAYTLKISHILAMTKLNVLSAALHIDKARGIDLWGSAHLSDADNRVSAHLSFGFDNSYRCFAEVAGTKGRVNSERIFTAPPNFETTICQHMESGRTIQHKFAPANHFELMLAYFEKICGNREMREKEYAANLDQARLVQKVVNCSANAF